MASTPNGPQRPRRGTWLASTQLAVVLIAAAVVALDQAAKAIIQAGIDRGDTWPSEGWPVRLVHITNSGAAFGILQDTGPLLVIASLIGVGIIVSYLLAPGVVDPMVRLGLALMLGGAIGNLIDRFAAGEVVDFIKFPSWPAFNVADSAITIGVFVLLWAMLRPPDHNEPAQAATSESSSRTEPDGSTR